MRKRVLSILMALSMALTAMPTVAWANDSSDEDWTDYVEETISFIEGNENALKWIDRIDLPTFARDFYDVLVEASDGDGKADYLMDAKYYSLDEAEEMDDEPIWVVSDDLENGEEHKSIILEATIVTLEDDLDDSQKEMVENAVNDYVSAAYSAFDADHPEVFWLYRKAPIGGFSYTNNAGELKYVAGLTLAEYKVDGDNEKELLYQKRVKQFLDETDELYIPGAFINQSANITNKEAILNWSTNRANEIIGEFSGKLEGFKAHLTNNGLISEEDTTLDTAGLTFFDLTKAGKIAYFDYWLVSHNDYNTDLANETEESFGGSLDVVSARECISAMVGKRGNQGPVCAGFTRGMKALCDAAQIGCVIVESIPEEKHTWNYVQVDNGDWFGLDTTWNEAEGEAVADYLLANRATMDEGHTVENKGWGNIIFPDTPTIQESRFAFAPGWLVNVGASNKRITEIKEVKIDGIVAPVLGEAPVTTGFSVNSDTVHVSISKNEENVEIPITWTDAKGASVGSRFAANTVYQAAFMIEPDDNYTFGNNTKVTITGAPEGTAVNLDASNGKVIVTFPATENNAPVFSPDGGSFRGSQTVAITAPEGYEIYYTTDGSLPNQDLTVEGNTTAKYKEEITLTATTTIKAIAVKDDMISAVAEATFTRKHSSGSSSGGGGGSVSEYTITVSSTTNGKITLDKTTASKGSIVTIISQANDGFTLDKITATDKNGSEIKLTDKGNGTYTFTMPASKVEIKTAFKETEKVPDTDNSSKDEVKQAVVKMQINSKNLLVNGVSYEKDVAPVIRNDRTLVPIRVITETLGGKVDWNGATKEVTLTIDGKEIKMTVGKTLEKYGVAPVIIDGRTFVPVRFVADELGATIAWDDATKTVTIAK